MRVAVIGSGISGNAAAWALAQPMQPNPLRDVVLYEKRNRPGGHSHTIDIDYDGRALAVDVGFIVYNTLNYPNLVALFDHLGVKTIESDMSFGVSMARSKARGRERSGARRLEWSGNSLDTIFAQRRNFFSPTFWQMIGGILRFNRRAAADLEAGRLKDRSLGHYLRETGFKRTFIDWYLAPMGAAIWSTPHADILDFPAESFVRFFANHRLMHATSERPKWRTVAGGSRSYVSKITAPFQENIRLDSTVTAVHREGGKVHIVDQSGHHDVFDHVIFAAHTDQTLAMIKDTTPREHAVLSAIGYRANTIYLHRDPGLMPRDRKVWSAWNYIETPDAVQAKTGVCVSYHMNALQKIDDTCPLFVSLNPEHPPRADLTFAVTTFDHPQFDAKALNAQRALPEIQGEGNYWYCGAWCGHGFHEDGLKSGLEIAERLGAVVPWRAARSETEDQLEAAE